MCTLIGLHGLDINILVGFRLSKRLSGEHPLVRTIRTAYNYWLAVLNELVKSMRPTTILPANSVFTFKIVANDE